MHQIKETDARQIDVNLDQYKTGAEVVRVIMDVDNKVQNNFIFTEKDIFVQSGNSLVNQTNSLKLHIGMFAQLIFTGGSGFAAMYSD